MIITRWILGRIILLLDFITSPRSQNRPAEQQSLVDNQTANLALYQYQACPFCVKVRRSMKRHSLNIELRDVKRDQTFREELVEQGGQLKVPCLKIIDDDGESRWMYESNDIISYLEGRFVPAA
ncbi:MAG: glutathione S-transferase N-terminal domain-containing protein [Motiliproteus sp.]|nr:glutathione S-transferase N-terminal domain-containing protein [Motiliproteus sp.]MCW9051929.1 glutathione S-transferase N-terminal domain-containing protein [Motiliproteus sp.]